MCKKIFILVLLLVGSITISFGQSTESKQQDNAFAPFSPEEESSTVSPTKKSSKSKKKNKKNAYAKYEITMEQKVKEFEERMEANAKEYKKMQKEMQKPQYSDPMYFGHKKKPKKRKPGKRKFCKECGIVH